MGRSEQGCRQLFLGHYLSGCDRHLNPHLNKTINVGDLYDNDNLLWLALCAEKMLNGVCAGDPSLDLEVEASILGISKSSSKKMCRGTTIRGVERSNQVCKVGRHVSFWQVRLLSARGSSGRNHYLGHGHGHIKYVG